MRRDHRNGAYTRDLVTSVGRIEALRVPRTRRGFRTQVFERYQRRRREVDEGIGWITSNAVRSITEEIFNPLLDSQPDDLVYFSKDFFFAALYGAIFGLVGGALMVWQLRRAAA